MKLLNGLHQVGGPGLTHPHDAASYLMRTQKGAFLIDCGTPAGYEQLLANIRRQEVEPGEIRRVFGTHGHFDHVGAADRFRRDLGCGLLLHGADREPVETGDPVKTTAALLYGEVFPPCPVEEELTDGQEYDLGDVALKVIHTPGHSPGSVCFALTIQGLSVLIAGDAVHGGYSPRIGSDEATWRKSLEKLTAMHFDLYSFGHTGPVLLGDADRRLACAAQSFANYYNPWFKDFYRHYPY